MDRLDVRPDDAEYRRQQRERGEHRGHHCDGRRVAERGHERNPCDQEREEGDHDGRAGEDDRAARGGDRHRDRLVELHPLLAIVAVARDQEERVVDADAEADHRRDRRTDARDGHRVAEHRDQRQAHDQAEHRRDDRQAHRDERSEREGEDDHRGGQADDLAALRCGLGELASH